MMRVGRARRYVVAGPFDASNSFRASSAPLNPTFEWVPSQNGLFTDAPQRQSEIFVFSVGIEMGLPSWSMRLISEIGASMRYGPFCLILMVIGIVDGF